MDLSNAINFWSIVAKKLNNIEHLTVIYRSICGAHDDKSFISVFFIDVFLSLDAIYDPNV